MSYYKNVKYLWQHDHLCPTAGEEKWTFTHVLNLRPALMLNVATISLHIPSTWQRRCVNLKKKNASTELLSILSPLQETYCELNRPQLLTVLTDEASRKWKRLIFFACCLQGFTYVQTPANGEQSTCPRADVWEHVWNPQNTSGWIQRECCSLVTTLTAVCSEELARPWLFLRR